MISNNERECFICVQKGSLSKENGLHFNFQNEKYYLLFFTEIGLKKFKVIDSIRI
jgi:hypothetical protein